MVHAQGESSGKWLEEALVELCASAETALDLDREVISGLVAYCELAEPLDAKGYLDNIIGEETGRTIIQEYINRRSVSIPIATPQATPTSQFQTYIKPTQESEKKPAREASATLKKKKGGKPISLAEAAKGSIVFNQGQPCACQARRHNLVGNCLSCGKIVCEQEGEGPCNFCGSLVLKEGSTYAGLEISGIPLSHKEAEASAFAKKLVEYDRNSAARTVVIDDQSDYYEIEGNSWLSKEEKGVLMRKKEEMEERERAKKEKVVVTFDLVGRKVIMSEDEAFEVEESIMRPLEGRVGQENRVKPNPSVVVQPVFVRVSAKREGHKIKQSKINGGLCLEVSGRVLHENANFGFVGAN